MKKITVCEAMTCNEVEATSEGSKRHKTGQSPKKSVYDELTARLLGKLGQFRVLDKIGRLSDLVGVMGSMPVVVEVKSPAEPPPWRVCPDVKGITPTGRRFMPSDFAMWRAMLVDRAKKVAPPRTTGLVRTYAVAATSQLLRYALDYPDLSAKYAEWTGLPLPHVKHPRDVVALLAVPLENAGSADLAMRLISDLKYATGEVLTEDAHVRVYRIRYLAFPRGQWLG
jgi:hypothetical protein